MAMTLWLSDADVASLRRRAERERRSIEDVLPPGHIGQH
jgi:hypothetical protein